MWLTGHILATVDAADDSANWRLEVAGTIAAACQGDPNLIALLVVTVASALSRGVVLTGSSELDPLRQRVATYPQPLAVAVASRHGQIDNFWRWQMFADRGDLIALHAHFAAAVDRLAHLLSAANQRWWPGRKWLLHELASLEHLPTSTVEALHLAAAASPSDAARVLTELIEAAYDLAKRQLPDLDVARLRRIFRFQRQPLERMPVQP
jgi:hypothetical protein